MGRRLNQYLGSFGDRGRPRVVFVFDDEEAPVDAEHVFRLNLKGRRPVAEEPEAPPGAPDAVGDGGEARRDRPSRAVLVAIEPAGPSAWPTGR